MRSACVAAQRNTRALVLAFIDAFMLAYIAPFYQAFAAKLTFHLFAYTLLASLTAVLYAAYRATTDLKIYGGDDPLVLHPGAHPGLQDPALHR